MSTELYFKLTGNTRESIRKNVVEIFLEEKAGKGKKELSSKYIYYVETLDNGKRVYLKRPAYLNKGMDFTVHLENTSFREKGANRDIPSHSEIVNDLLNKKTENPQEYEKVKTILNKLFNCQEVSDIEYRNIYFFSGIEIEGILKVIKWLFIEQDITYWNFSGRYMLYEGFKKLTLI